MTRRVRVVVVIALAAAAPVGGQQPIHVDGPDRARATTIVRRALAVDHEIMLSDSTRRLVLPRGAEVPRTLLILGGDASVGATVRGDLIVVGGDLFLLPGANVDGRTIAIGGGVYGSTLAVVRGGTESLRDHTFDVAGSADAIRLAYRYIGGQEPGVELPLMEGLRIPAYDRVNGVSAAWGPVLRPTIRWVIDPTVTYRSHLGELDLAVNAIFRLGERYTLTVDGRRGTFTNEGWIYSDFINSFNTLWNGRDVRNYYRADRSELEVRRFDEYVRSGLELERFVSLTTERAWSVGPTDTLGGAPWSLIEQSDPGKMLRANPAIEDGWISSAVIGAVARYQLADVRMQGTTRVEIPWQTPGDQRFGQLTFNGTIRFPTFGVQRFRLDVHAVVTVGDTAPPQRFAYLGGSGTMPVMDDLLSMGGDQLLHFDSRYEIPIERVKAPFLGSPTFAIRHRIGSAGVQGLPPFFQNIGPVLTWSLARIEWVVDPATGNSHFGYGLSFVR
jgi:hypothetical protein